MNKLITTITLIFATTISIYCQTINDKPISDIDVEYVQIVGTSKFMSTKLTIEIDFGQENKLWTAKDTELKDESGKKMVFNSMIDSLNFMNKVGYDFVTAYVITVANQNVYHYLLKKRPIQK